MTATADLVRELRDDFPAVDVTTVVFSRDFAGVGCCVIPQEKVLEIISALESKLTDYQNEKKAEKTAHKYRWLVWLFVPVALFLASIFIPIIVFLHSGKVLEW